MTLDTRLSAAVPTPDPMWLPDPPPAATAWRPSVPRPPVMQAPPKLLAKVGEAFAGTLALLQERLRQADAADFQACLAELERLEHLGLEVQQMARVMGHGGAHRPEAVDLGDALTRAFALWAPAARTRGVALNQPDATTARVMVDPAVLEQVLDLAIELAFDAGDSLAARVRLQPATQQALLLVDMQRGGPITSAGSLDPQGDDDPDSLRWLMLHQAARAGGIAARREPSGSMLSVVLTFPLAVPGQAMGNSV